MRTSKGGGELRQIGTLPSGFDVFIEHEDFVYASAQFSRALMRVAKDGGAQTPAETLFELPDSGGVGVAVSAGFAHVLCGVLDRGEQTGAALIRVRLD